MNPERNKISSIKAISISQHHFIAGTALHLSWKSFTSMYAKAPIAFFAYKRPKHTQRALESLMHNEGADQSELFIFCDGAKKPDDREAVEQVRTLIRSQQWCGKVHMIEREANIGLANSIISGVTDLCQRYGRVIVLEDDLILAPYFLDYMNQALEIYKDNDRVMQISGYMFPIALDKLEETTFLPLTSSWGWATWHRAWKQFDPEMSGYAKLKANDALRHQFDLNGSYYYFSMLEAQREGRIDSWAIRWYLSSFMQGGLVLYPTRSLVNNIGLDGSGTHYNKKYASSNDVNANLPTQKTAISPKLPEADKAVINALFSYLKSSSKKQTSLPRRAVNKLKELTGSFLKKSTRML